MEQKVFILSKEAYMIDMIDKYFETEDNDFLFDPESNPKHQEFADFYCNNLLNNEHVIDFDGDTVFIVGCTYKEARLLFGEMVCNETTTKKLLAEMLIEKYKLNMIDAWGVEDLIFFNREFKTKEDIENWLEELAESLT